MAACSATVTGDRPRPLGVPRRRLRHAVNEQAPPATRAMTNTAVLRPAAADRQ